MLPEVRDQTARHDRGHLASAGQIPRWKDARLVGAVGNEQDAHSLIVVEKRGQDDGMHAQTQPLVEAVVGTQAWVHANKLGQVPHVADAGRRSCCRGKADKVACFAGQTQLAHGIADPGHRAQMVVAIGDEDSRALCREECSNALHALEEQIVERGQPCQLAA